VLLGFAAWGVRAGRRAAQVVELPTELPRAA